MEKSEVTITLPMSGQGLGVILTALGIGLATGFLWLVLREQERKSERAPLALLTAFGWLVVPVWLVLFAGTLWQLWLILSGGDSALVGSGSFGAGALIAALLGAPFVVWGTVLRHQTLRYQKEGHITDRITAAVEQLGAEKTISYVARNISHPAVPPGEREGPDDDHVDRLQRINAKTASVHRTIDPDFEYGHWSVFTETVPNIEVRIGAILSLERIAQDSTINDEGRDHVRVMEILCAYLRENAPATNLNETPTPFETKKPRIDIQAVINVIKRRGTDQQAIEAKQKYRLDLRMVSFDGCDLSKGPLRGAILNFSRFEGANLSSADLTGASLDGSLLNFANFVATVLHGTYAQICTYSEGNIFSSLSRSDLQSIWIEGAKITNVHINERNASKFFGFRDTGLREDLERHKREGLKIAERVESGDEDVEFDAADVAKDTPKAYLFQHWKPYKIDDGRAGLYRHRFIEKHGLRGWPFED